MDYDEIRSMAFSRDAFKLIEGGRLEIDVRTGTAGQTTVDVHGECPRCVHYHAATFSPDVVLSGQPGDDGAGRLRGRQEIKHVVVCDCAEVHSGRPDGVTGGCGLRYLLQFEMVEEEEGSAAGRDDDDDVGGTA